MVGLYGIGSVWMCSDRSAGNEGRNFISNIIIFITSILNYGKRGNFFGVAVDGVILVNWVDLRTSDASVGRG